MTKTNWTKNAIGLQENKQQSFMVDQTADHFLKAF
jgi:hypothetical protein